MSQHITIKGVYRNNKINVVGTHNPHNNRNFNLLEINHLKFMTQQHIIPNLNKFKQLNITMHSDGKEIYNGNLNIDMFNEYALNDIITELLSLYNYLNYKGGNTHNE